MNFLRNSVLLVQKYIYIKIQNLSTFWNGWLLLMLETIGCRALEFTIYQRIVILAKIDFHINQPRQI